MCGFFIFYYSPIENKGKREKRSLAGKREEKGRGRGERMGEERKGRKGEDGKKEVRE